MFICLDPTPSEEGGDEPSIPVKKRRSTSAQHRAMVRTPLVTLAGHTQPAVTVRWPSEDELLTGGWDHCIRLWDTTSGINKGTLVRCGVLLVTIELVPLVAPQRMVQKCSTISTRASRHRISLHPPTLTSLSEYGTNELIVSQWHVMV